MGGFFVSGSFWEYQTDTCLPDTPMATRLASFYESQLGFAHFLAERLVEWQTRIDLEFVVVI